MRILFCNPCGWAFPGDATGVAIVHECPECRTRNRISFIQGTKEEVLKELEGTNIRWNPQ
jgi:hypothetical protein